MGKIKLVIHGKLNHFLGSKWKDQAIVFELKEKVSLKHILESLGIPHPEVGEVRLGDNPISLEYHVQDDDMIDVFPYDQQKNHLENENIRFVLDNHLGKLCDYLRLLGFDALYEPIWTDDTIAEIAGSQNRIVLTRDRGLLKRKIVRRGYCVRKDDPKEQIDEIIQHFGIEKEVQPFKRCSRCNGILQPVEKQQIMDQLQPLTKLYYDEFMRCPDCGQIYWKGSHYERMQEFISKFENYNKSEGEN